jgi:hypothetical protein
MQGWRVSGRPVFPLIYGEPTTHFLGNERFRRHIQDDSVVLRCETRWIRVDPGTNASSPAFGYIQIDQAGRRMAVYHKWGEG